jgi:hypothetical protein
VGVAKDLGAYPKSYMDLAGAFEGAGGAKAIRRKTVKCASAAAAASLRFDLYAFKATMRKTGMADDYPNFTHTRMYVDGKTLRIVHADDTAPSLK